MNNVTLIGRLTKDPDVRVIADSQKSVARFSLAIDRGKDKDGKSLGADFPNVVAFGKVAELIEKFFTKGKPICVIGRLQTGSYEKDGHKVYTTDVVAERIEFLPREAASQAEQNASAGENPFDGFAKLNDEDIPF